MTMKFLAVIHYIFFACSILLVTRTTVLCSALHDSTHDDFEDLMTMVLKPPRDLETKIITINAAQDDGGNRRLQFEDSPESRCYSTRNEKRPDRYCSFANTPREGTFLKLSCPDSTGDDLSLCGCTIGVGTPDDAPNADTCNECDFCSDGTLAYDCRNIAEGTCIGRNCRGECVSSLEDPEDLLVKEEAKLIRSGSSSSRGIRSYGLLGLFCVSIAGML